MVRFDRPIDNSPFTLIGWNETFYAFNDTDWGARSGYDQNRLFVGGGWTIQKNLRLEGGYLFNHVRREAAPNSNNHAVSLTLSVKL